MKLITETDSQQMLERAAEARLLAVGQVASHHGSLGEREALAGSVFRQYSCELLEDLLRVAPTDDNGPDSSAAALSAFSAWVRRRHDEELIELGRELRDAFPEGEARHAVAQVIQRELLEAERRLKYALNLPGHPLSTESESPD